METYTLPRAKTLVLALGVCLLGSQVSVAQTGATHSPVQKHERSLAIIAERPAGFFTIAGRVAALRAKGALGTAGTGHAATNPVSTALLIEKASLGEVSLEQEPAQRANDLGLRGSLSDYKPDTVLGSVGFPLPGGELAGKWDAVMARWEGDKYRIEQCRITLCTHASARKWLEIQDKAAQHSGSDQLSFVHSAINRSISYATDFQIFGNADYWASPLEVMERAGDCEDYAIAKYLMLRTLGVDAADMKLVAIFETFSGQHHAILAIRHEGDWLFLDNKRTTLTTAKDYADTRPVATVDAINGQSMLVSMGPRPLS